MLFFPFVKLHSLLLPILLLCSGLASCKRTADSRPVIPDRWVRRALAAVREQDTAAWSGLILQFDTVIEPRSDSFPEAERPVPDELQINSIDLDNDGKPEHIVGLNGLDVPFWLCVLKQREDREWSLLDVQEIRNREDLAVRTYRIKGRTLWYFTYRTPASKAVEWNAEWYSVFCLMDDTVRQVADILGSHKQWGSSLDYLNCDVDALFVLKQGDIEVRYHYSLYPAVKYGDETDDWEASRELAFLEGRTDVHYLWNPDRVCYAPAFLDDGFSEQKLMAMESLDGTLLLSAFHAELDSVRAAATGRKKDLIEYVFSRTTTAQRLERSDR